jgi:aminoglycoside phosphotransferase (APT) family kinase protein
VLDDLISLGALDEWIGDKLPGRPTPLNAGRMGEGTGIANALYLIGRGQHRWVLRRPPVVKNDPSASDTKREWRILCALEGTDIPHPAPRLFCDDPDVIGSTFMIMDVVDGFTPGFELPPAFEGNEKRRYQLGLAYVDGCAALSKVDWQARGLEGLGKPEGFLERQVGRWTAQLDRYRTRPLPKFDFVAHWLEDNRPVMSPAGLLHGDYSPFNVMVAPDPPPRLAAILDWDTGTIGDPLLDLGHLLARWTEPGEDPVITLQAGGAGGYPSRAEMSKRYAEQTGRDLTSLPYYEVLALFKLAVILEGGYARQAAAGVPDGQNSMSEMAPRLLRGAAEFAWGQRV